MGLSMAYEPQISATHSLAQDVCFVFRHLQLMRFSESFNNVLEHFRHPVRSCNEWNLAT